MINSVENKKIDTPSPHGLAEIPQAEAGREATRPGIRIHNARDVLRLLARVTNGLLRDEIEESRAAKIGYLCSVMLSALEEVRVSRFSTGEVDRPKFNIVIGPPGRDLEKPEDLGRRDSKNLR